MWILLPFGFYSVVQKPGTDYLTVRARDAADLDRLRAVIPALSHTIHGGGTDYPARATVTHAAFAEGMSQICHDLNYSNVKGKIGAVLGHARAAIASRAWGVFRGIEDAAIAPRPLNDPAAW